MASNSDIPGIKVARLEPLSSGGTTKPPDGGEDSAKYSPGRAVNVNIAFSNDELTKILGLVPGLSTKEDNADINEETKASGNDDGREEDEARGFGTTGDVSNNNWEPPSQLPPDVNQQWQLPPDLPPEINKLDQRFVCPPTPSDVDPNLEQDMGVSLDQGGTVSGSDSAVKDYASTDAVLLNEMSPETQKHDVMEAEMAAVERGMTGSILAEQNRPQLDCGPPVAGAAECRGRRREAAHQCQAQSRQDDKHNSDDDSLFGDSSADEEMEEEGNQQSNEGGSLKINNVLLQPKNDESDDDASLFGDSDDEVQEAQSKLDNHVPTSSSHPQEKLGGPRPGDDSAQGPDKIAIFHPPAPKQGEDNDSDCVSTDDGSVFSLTEDKDDGEKKPPPKKPASSGGFLGGLINKVKKDRDVRSFGETGYKIKRKDTSRKKETKNLIHHMKPPPPQQTQKLTPMDKMHVGRQQAEKDEMAAIIAAARESQERVRERQLQKQMERSSATSAVDEAPMKKTVTFAIGKSARAMDVKTSELKSKLVPSASVSASDTKEVAASEAKAKRSKKDWNKKFSSVQQYIHTHGTCDVPSGHSLERWIAQQRNVCGRWLNRDDDVEAEPSEKDLERHRRISRLLAINFDWGKNITATVKEALAREAMLFSPAQRESLGLGRDVVEPKKKKRTGLAKRNSSIVQHSIFDSISSKKRQRQPLHSSDDDDEEEFEYSEDVSIADLAKHGVWVCNCGNRVLSTKSRCGECLRWRGGKRKGGWKINSAKRSAASKTVTDSSDEGTARVKEFNSKKRSSDDEYEYSVDDSGFEDERPGSISWNASKRSNKRRKHVICGMPASLWVDLLAKTKDKSASNDASPEGQQMKCWSNLERAGSIITSNESPPGVEVKIAYDRAEEEDKMHSTSSPGRRNFKRTSSTDAKSPPMKSMARTLLKRAEPEMDHSISTFRIGKRVYAAWWRTRDRSGPAVYYPGAIESFNFVNEKVLYNINFDDGDRVTGIDASLVIPRKEYLKQNLKPQLKAGDRVYAAWWENPKKRGTEATWFPGVIKGFKERHCGGRYGLFRLYDVEFDDGDEIDSLEDYFVMNKSDYLIATRNTGDEEDGDDGQSKWIGVKNVVDESSVDIWAQDVGWYAATIDGKEQSFPLLSDALRAYDSHVVDQKGPKTTKSDLNLPEEWAFPSPYGICPPVHIGGDDLDEEDEDHSGLAAGSNKEENAEPDPPSQASPTTMKHDPIADIKPYIKEDATPQSADQSNGNPRPVKNTDSSNKVDKEDTTKIDNTSHSMIKSPIEQESIEDATSHSATTNNGCGSGSNSSPEMKSVPSLLDEPAAKLDTNAPMNHGEIPTPNDETSPDAAPVCAPAGSAADQKSSANPTLSERESMQPALPAEGFPEQWTVRKIPRQKGSKKSKGGPLADSFWYSPKMNYRFRSKTEASRFLGYLGKSGDEERAMEEFRGSTKRTLPTIRYENISNAGTAGGKTAKAALGHTRSSTKAILNLIDLTNPEATSESPTNVGAAVAPPASSQAKAASKKSASTLSERDLKYPAEPAEDFPSWTVRKIPRQKGSHVDNYWYSPKMNYRFRSRKAVERFLGCLQATNGDEEMAIQEFQGVAANSHKKTTESSSLPRTIELTYPEAANSPKNIGTAVAPPASSQAKAASLNSGSKSRTSALSERESKYPTEPAEGFPSWTVRKIPRQKGSHVDNYWYSPKMNYRFRSRKAVERFLDCLQATNGDEEMAMQEFQGAANSSKTTEPMTLARADSSSSRVVEYIEPSKSFDNQGEKDTSDKNGDGKEEIKQEKMSSDVGVPVGVGKYLKPIIKKREQVFACWSDLVTGMGTDWYPGRVWDVKESPGGEFGPARKYDVVFDDGDANSDIDDIWVLKKSEYEMAQRKPEGTWIGVTNKIFPESKDEYARLIGWYVVDGTDQVYSSLEEALRAHDLHIVETKGMDNVSAKELNFPEEHDIIV